MLKHQADLTEGWDPPPLRQIRTPADSSRQVRGDPRHLYRVAGWAGNGAFLGLAEPQFV